MPITRKINRRKDGTFLITLPRDWVRNSEKKIQKKLEEVFLEVDEKITISVSL